MLGTAALLSLLAPHSLASAVVAQPNATTIAPRLVRTPNVSGDTVVFSYAGDLWVSSLKGGVARRLTTVNGVETRPRISPDGKWVAFTASYDGAPNVYVIPIEGGEPKRLTYNAEGDAVVGWTPDGRIAFATASDQPYLGRQRRLNLISPEGGRATRTVLDEFTEGSFFADGNRVAYTRVNSYDYNWRRYRGGTQGRIGLYSFPDNKYSEIPTGREQNYFPMTIGNDVYYVSDRDFGTLNLFRYRNGNITRLTEFKDADIRYPSTDGKTIVWERDGRLAAYDVASGRISEPAVRVLSENLATRPTLTPMAGWTSAFAISPTGVRMAVEARGEVFSVPVDKGDTRNLSDTQGPRERLPAWSPDGSTIYYLSDADGEFNIYAKPARGGEARKITNNRGTSITGFQIPLQGDRIFYTRSDYTLWMVPTAGGAPKMVYDFEGQTGAMEPSPDGRYVAVIDAGSNELGRVRLVEIATGKVTDVTDGFYADTDVSWDPAGDYLYIASNRTFNPTFGVFEFSLKVDEATRVYAIPLRKNVKSPLISDSDEEPEPPKPPATPPAAPAGPPAAPQTPPATPPRPAGPPPIQIDFDNINERAIPLPLPAGNYGGLVGVRGGLLYLNAQGLWRYDLASKQSAPVIQGPIFGLSLNPARTKVAWRDPQGVKVADVRPGAFQQAQRVSLDAMQAVIDPRKEWKQIYWEAWRYQRDYFYDPKFNGVDWNAMGKKYEAYLADVNSRSDLNVVMGQLIGELGTGHAYITAPGDLGAMPRRLPVGHLGADFAPSGTGLKFSRIYRGNSYEESEVGPLNGVDVNEGDFLISIDGQPVTSTTEPKSLMIGKVGQYVTLVVAKDAAGTQGRREIRIRPIASEIKVRYIEMVESNRKKVLAATGGRVGYMHIQNTAAEGAQDFVRGFYSQNDKDGMIVDERWNGGGYIQPWFVDTLARRTRAGIQVRNANDSQDAVAIEGPKVMLINQYAGSGGDFFPWMFRQQKLGPLVGKRTWGGLVGISSGAQLVDGGGVTAPGFAIYDLDTNEVIAENRGVEPDVDVDNRPDLVAQGKDPQLERAIQIVLENLKKNPPRKPRKDFPRLGKDAIVRPDRN